MPDIPDTELRPDLDDEPVNVRLYDGHTAQLDELAEDRGVQRSSLIRIAVNDFLSDYS